MWVWGDRSRWDRTSLRRGRYFYRHGWCTVAGSIFSAGFLKVNWLSILRCVWYLNGRSRRCVIKGWILDNTFSWVLIITNDRLVLLNNYLTAVIFHRFFGSRHLCLLGFLGARWRIRGCLGCNNLLTWFCRINRNCATRSYLGFCGVGRLSRRGCLSLCRVWCRCGIDAFVADSVVLAILGR